MAGDSTPQGGKTKSSGLKTKKKGPVGSGHEKSSQEEHSQSTRDSNRTEAVQRELFSFGYPLHDYLVKMKRCCFVSQGMRPDKFGVKVYYNFYSDKQCRQVHDLLD